MIAQLAGHIEKKTLDEIVSVILRRYKRFLNYTEKDDYKELFSDVYSAHRRKHTLSWAIDSAFIQGQHLESEIEILLHTDKGNHRRPALISKKIIIYILSNSTKLDALYLREKYLLNAQNFSNEQLFCYILYTEKNERLIDLSICLPDDTGKVIAKESLKNEAQLIRIVA